MALTVCIQEKDFSVHEELQNCRQRLAGRAGAIVSFIGLVREQSTAGSVSSLFLEHYPGMTESSIERILAQAQNRWNILDAVVIHRVGELQPDDQIVLVIVASTHRADAFTACEFIMDFLKTEAVFWKKEVRLNESVWIESTTEDLNRATGWKK